MSEKIINILRFIYVTLVSKPKMLLYVIANKNKFYSAESYYPEMKKKSSLTILCEQLAHVLKYAEINDFYFLFGFDIKNFRKQSDYLNCREFMILRDGQNSPKGKNYSSIGVLRDKFVFNVLMQNMGFNPSPIVGLLQDGKLFNLKTKQWIDFVDYFSNKKIDLFCKAIDEECGVGVYHVEKRGNELYANSKSITFLELMNLLGSLRMIVEERIIQHSELAKYHANSVNTMRITTVTDVNSNDIIILPPILRVGAGDNSVDNWTRGGLIIEVSLEGTVGKYGYYKPGYGTKESVHPDSGVIFEGQKIPMFAEVLDMVTSMHKAIGAIHSIGWDIAISEQGPIVIEGNDNWEITGPQLVEPMKGIFTKCCVISK